MKGVAKNEKAQEVDISYDFSKLQLETDKESESYYHSRAYTSLAGSFSEAQLKRLTQTPRTEKTNNDSILSLGKGYKYEVPESSFEQKRVSFSSKKKWSRSYEI